jgi:thiosulfate/3-mercaptopyruvate sulfurtransferase
VNLLDKDSRRFKSAQELRKIFHDAHIDLEQPSAAHCQSGGRSSVMTFTMELMGAKRVANYYASWAEWSSADDTPIVVAKPEKAKK